MKTAKEINDMFIEQEVENQTIEAMRLFNEEEACKNMDCECGCMQTSEDISEDAINRLIESCIDNMNQFGNTKNAYVFVTTCHSERTAILAKRILKKLDYITREICYFPSQKNEDGPDTDAYWSFELRK